MSTTSLWVPVSSAIAALLGGGIGAALQGHFGVTGWRRQVRLEAYAAFVNASHDFNFCLNAAIDQVGKQDFDEKLLKVQEARHSVGRQGSLVVIVGPSNMERAANEVAKKTQAILNDLKNEQIRNQIAKNKKTGGRYEKFTEWRKAADSFAESGRRILRTDEGAGRTMRQIVIFPFRSR